MLMQIGPNIIAMVCSLIAILQLGMAVPRMGGLIGKILKLIIAGIFFSVFIHASLELAAAFGLIGEKSLMVIMGILISIGSLFFIIAGSLALKTFKK